MNFEESRTKELIDAEHARGGQAPAAALILMVTTLVEHGASIATVKKMVPTIVQAIILATGERDGTFKVLSRAIQLFGEDLADIGREGSSE